MFSITISDIETRMSTLGRLHVCVDLVQPASVEEPYLKHGVSFPIWSMGHLSTLIIDPANISTLKSRQNVVEISR